MSKNLIVTADAETVPPMVPELTAQTTSQDARINNVLIAYGVHFLELNQRYPLGDAERAKAINAARLKAMQDIKRILSEVQVKERPATKRQKNIMASIMRGETNQRIAEGNCLSKPTKDHRKGGR